MIVKGGKRENKEMLTEGGGTGCSMLPCIKGSTHALTFSAEQAVRGVVGHSLALLGVRLQAGRQAAAQHSAALCSAQESEGSATAARALQRHSSTPVHCVPLPRTLTLLCPY